MSTASSLSPLICPPPRICRPRRTSCAQWHAAFPIDHRLGRIAAPARAGGNIRHDAARAPIIAPAPIVMWSATPTCPPIMTKSPTCRAAGYADLGDDQAMPSDRGVVCDLDEIVDLGALADDRIAGRAAIDRRVGADFHVVLDDDAPGLRNFLMPLRTRQIAEAVLADTGAGMDDDAIADQRVQDRGAGADRAVASDATPGPITAPAAISVPAPISARGPMTASGSTVTPASRRAVGCTVRRRRAAGHAEQRRWPQRSRETARAPPRRRPDRVAASPAPRAAAAPAPQTAARSSRRRRACRPVRPRYFGLSRKLISDAAAAVERRDIADAPVERIAAPRLGARQRGDLADRQLAIWLCK